MSINSKYNTAVHFDRLFQILSSPRFLNKEGLGGELPFFIHSYPVQKMTEVELNIEGDIHRAILQDAQFHPVNEMILHVDFLEITADKPIKIEVPVKIIGNSPGVIKGGKMVQKLRKVSLRGLVGNIPDFVTADISGLDLGQTVKVNKLKVEGCEILNPLSNPVATIDIPRALRGKLTA